LRRAAEMFRASDQDDEFVLSMVKRLRRKLKLPDRYLTLAEFAGQHPMRVARGENGDLIFSIKVSD
jgi:hypothetical protein